MNESNDLNVDELLAMLEEMQDQEELNSEQLEAEKQKNSEAQEEILRLSSENSLLRNTLQQKSETIISLNEKIGMLQESDKVLEENLRLRKENSELQEKNSRIKREAEAAVSAAKEKYDTLIGRIDSREQKIEKRESEIEQRIQAQDEEVTRLSENRIIRRMRQMETEHQRREAVLEKEYSIMRSRYAWIIFMVVAYGLLTTVITAIRTDVITSDAILFGGYIEKGLTKLFEFAKGAGGFVSQVADLLPRHNVSVVMHWVLLVLTEAGIFGGTGLLVFLVIRAYIRFLKDKQADEITAWAMLMDTAVTVFLADEIKTLLSVNLILAFLLIFAAYSLIRAVLQIEDIDVKNAMIKIVLILGGSIVGLILMVHFFGAIGVFAIPIGLFLGGGRR